MIVGDYFVSFTLLEILESLPETLGKSLHSVEVPNLTSIGVGINNALSRMASVQRQLEALSQDTALWEKLNATRTNTAYKNPLTVRLVHLVVHAIMICSGDRWTRQN